MSANHQNTAYGVARYPRCIGSYEEIFDSRAVRTNDDETCVLFFSPLDNFFIDNTSQHRGGVVEIAPGKPTNVTYKFPAQKNVSLFAEVSDTDDTDDTDVLAGMRIKF